MARREEGAYPKRSVTDEQRSQPALSTKTLRATVLFEWGVVGSAITDRSGSAQASPPSPTQKSLVAVPFLFFGQALRMGSKRLSSVRCRAQRVAFPARISQSQPERPRFAQEDQASATDPTASSRLRALVSGKCHETAILHPSGWTESLSREGTVCGLSLNPSALVAIGQGLPGTVPILLDGPGWLCPRSRDRVDGLPVVGISSTEVPKSTHRRIFEWHGLA